MNNPFRPVKFHVMKDVFIEERSYSLHSTEEQFYTISHIGYTLNKDMEWEEELSPSYRTDEYLQNNRYTLDQAVEMALKYMGG